MVDKTIYHKLAQIKRRMQELAVSPVREEYNRLWSEFQREYQALVARHKQQKQDRLVLRQMLQQQGAETELAHLDRLSYLEKRERRDLRRSWQLILQPLAAEIRAIDKELQQLQDEYRQTVAQQQEKLLQEYLSLPEQMVEIVYQDRDIVVINKPPGLLSVPGLHCVDSAFTRLKRQLVTEHIYPVHRLDQATSGLLLFALNPQTQHQLAKNWHDRVYKIYEALIAKEITAEAGEINLPLGRIAPPRYGVVAQGKNSRTKFQVTDRGIPSRLILVPHTGRTHQLRVHCLAYFGCPIWGDTLYGCQQNAPRLYLHARELHFVHPRTGQGLELVQPTPF
ncbi:MAG: pseudouridine synthase [Pseudanabaenaceae cyanobacterium SKYGB_i_bin29]|nr:pseudouridine synthase [Pseudanabaenaceae cyanobacterium SKYG29]MDW8422327.1 pseudouridine synthase [Pseudanabaenaceae cyanobacterium SKYGB_i_bin29]